MKTCKICGELKRNDAFSLTYRRAGARRNQCNTCRNAREWDRRKALLPPRKPPPTREEALKLLEGHIPEPTVQNAVLACIRQFDAPVLARDVERTLDLPRRVVQRCVSRLAKKGVLTRRKFPVNVRRWNIRTRRFDEAETVKMMWLYELPEAGE